MTRAGAVASVAFATWPCLVGCAALPEHAEIAADPRREDAWPATEIVREIRVRVACDEEYRRRPDWRQDAVRRVRRASAAWERAFGLRWSPVECVDWESGGAAANLDELREELASRVPCGTADVVLGLTGQNGAAAAPTKYAERGAAENFGRVAIACADWPGQAREREIHTVAHELGHLLGAWHCLDPDTIMAEDSSDTERFDAGTSRLIPLVLGFDFARGIDSLDEAAVRKIDELWRGSHGPGAPQPVAEAYMFRGARHMARRDFAAAAGDLVRAVAILETWIAPDASRLVPCLVTLSWICDQASPRDEARAIDLARRARLLTEGSR